jgi:hypothetical protein
MTTSGDSGNAMTEIALALAMAFFAIMVLTMVSMGAGGPVKITQVGSETTKLVPSEPTAAKDSTTPTRQSAAQRIVIFDHDQFYDGQLQPITPAAVAQIDRPVLAVSPDLTLGQVLAAKRRLPVPDITVTTLDYRWSSTLKEMQK